MPPPTQSNLDEIDAEIVSSATVHSQQFSDQVQTNRSADDILKLRAHIAGQVNVATGRNRTRYAATRKGV